MSNDEIWLLKARLRVSVISGRSESQQDTFFGELLGEGNGSCAWQDDPRGRSTEQASHITETLGARHKDPLADRAA